MIFFLNLSFLEGIFACFFVMTSLLGLNIRNATTYTKRTWISSGWLQPGLGNLSTGSGVTCLQGSHFRLVLNRAEQQVDHRNLADQVKKAQADDNKVQTSILSFFAKKINFYLQTQFFSILTKMFGIAMFGIARLNCIFYWFQIIFKIYVQFFSFLNFILNIIFYNHIYIFRIIIIIIWCNSLKFLNIEIIIVFPCR